ncbi:hypothetical protein BUALT_Bualt10G0057300 [Buddleja alternifolia]|uniref:SWIM-type domain-containing protein n=1 Tax=Buddleja alternifolia TaxID=168488 RepID=A0AAV6X3L7_9LAMI|nr:hypothetical protein BUALT_Bualt10G0057300 [Buddleja alternifolia]
MYENTIDQCHDNSALELGTRMIESIKSNSYLVKESHWEGVKLGFLDPISGLIAQYDFGLDYVDFVVWVGGVIEWIPRVRYFGGKTPDKGIRECTGDADPEINENTEIHGEGPEMNGINTEIPVEESEINTEPPGEGPECNQSFTETYDDWANFAFTENNNNETNVEGVGVDLNETNTETHGGGPEFNENPNNECTKGEGFGINLNENNIETNVGGSNMDTQSDPTYEGGGDDEEEESLYDSSLSDCPNWMFEDFEGPEDDDIFASRPPDHARKLFKTLKAFVKKGFLARCRPIIGLDVCFLKGMYKGQLLTAIGRDGNDNIFPIAIAYVEIEKQETWKWFLNLLLRDIGSADEKWQKGLVEAIHGLAPTSEHRFCLKHMYNNFKGKYKGQDLKRLFWKAASTYSVKQHLRIMKEIERISPKIGKKETAYEWMWDDKFEVRHYMDNHIVYLNDRHCSCGMYQLVGYLCCHAVASLNYHNMSHDDYVDDYLKKDIYVRVYSHMINPVPGMHDFEESPIGSVEPPNVKVRVGRPRKVRRRDGNDRRDPNCVSRVGFTHTYAIYLQQEYNISTYTNPPHPNSTVQHNKTSGNAKYVETETAAQEEEQAQTNIDPQFESETAEGRDTAKGIDEQTPMEFDTIPLFERPSYSEHARHVESFQFNSNVNATPQMHQQPSQTASSLANEGPRADVHLPTQASSVPNVHLPKPPRPRKQSCPKLKRHQTQPQSQPQPQKKKRPPTSIADFKK